MMQPVARPFTPDRTSAPCLLLTRPLGQSRRFARDLRASIDRPLAVMVAPLMAPAFLAPHMPADRFAAVIFSSETAVQAFAALPAPPAVGQAYCVGARTAQAARKCGLSVRIVATDAADLIRQIIALGGSGPLLHARGVDSRGEVVEHLRAAGLTAETAIIYTQTPRPLTQKALTRLAQPRPVLLPLFSPRSAMLFVAASARHLACPLHVVAISPTAAAALPPGLCASLTIATAPDGPAMLRAVIDLLITPPFA